MKKSLYLIKLILILFVVFFLEVCSPSSKNNFRWYIFLLGASFFVYGFYLSDYTILGLLIPIGNGLSRLSPVPYSTASFLLCCVFLGLTFNPSFKINGLLKKENNLLPFYFFLFFFISSFLHLIQLYSPKIVFIVNRIGYLNTEIIYHIVGYELFVLFVSMILFYMIFNLYDEDKIKKTFILFAIGIVISSIVGILQFLEILKGKFGYIIEWEKRVNGLFSNFNSFSLSLSLLLPMFLFYFSKTEKIELKFLFFFSFVLGLINIFLTGTRSGIICFFLGLFFLFIYLFVKKKIKLVYLCYFLIFFVSVTLFFNFFKDYYPIKRIIESISITKFFDNIKTSRYIFWQAGIKLWKQNVLIGNGIKSFYKEFPNITQEWFSDNACNTYINYLSEIGVLGTSVFFVIIIYVIYSFIKSFVVADTYQFFLTATLISFFIVSFFGHHLDAEEVSLIFWFYLAIVFNNTKFSWNKIVNKILLSITVIFFVLSVINTAKEIKKIDIFKYRNYAGLYHPENLFGKTAQWSENKVFIKLDNAKNKKFVLEINPANVKNQNVKIFLNGKEYKTVDLQESTWTDIKFPINEDKLIIKIVPKYTFCPAGKFRYLFPFHGKDYRMLGVILRFYFSSQT